MSLASSAFQNLENVVKLKISQANLPGAPALIEELVDEIADVYATNGQLDDEHEELAQPYQELHHEHLKVGLRISEDMKTRNAASIMTNVEVQTGDGSQKPAEGSSGSSPAVWDSLKVNEKRAEVQQEQCPDMDDEDHCSDVDASLMDTETGINECKAGQPAAVLIDPEIDTEGQCEGAEDSRSLGHEHGDSLKVQ